MSENSFPCCGGKSYCDGEPNDGLNRRDFMKAATAGGISLAALFEVAPCEAQAVDALEAWNATLTERGATRIYKGDELKHIAMPMGGIGTGQIYLRGDGTINPWQNFNNFSFGAAVPGSFFAVRTKDAAGNAATRLLSTAPSAFGQGVEAIEYSGEYPYAWIRYIDAALPVQVSLEAFSPFIPLNTKDSGLPAVVFRFRVRNTSNANVEASICTALTNLIGWDGYARLDESLEHSEFGGNTNGFEQRADAGVLTCQGATGTRHSFATTARMFSNDSDVAFQMRHCKNLTVSYGRPVPGPKEAQTGDVYWASDINGRLSEDELKQLLLKVEAGATAIIACDEFSLIHDALNAKRTEAKADVFDDFESGTYAKWTVEGDAFGDAPAKGTHPGQQPVGAFQGNHLVNSFTKGDGPIGKMISAPFTIEKRFIHFMVGGGEHQNETCINLVIDGKVALSERGQNTEILRALRWDVTAHRGKAATLEILDANTGGWGHILVDNIQLSDSPRLTLSDEALAERLRDALPFTARSTRPYDGDAQLLKDDEPLFAGWGALGAFTPTWTARGLRLREGATVVLATKKRVPLIIAGPVGNGKLVICNGALESAATGNARKMVIGTILAAATGNGYTPQTGISDDSPLAGTLALGLLNDSKSQLQHCLKATREAIWKQFASGALGAIEFSPTEPGHSTAGALSGTTTLAPNEERTMSFVLAWHFPNRTRDDTYGWGPQRYQYDHRLGNQYNNWFKNAGEVVDYVATNDKRLSDETRLFHTTFHNSTLPQYYLDAVTANASIIRSPIYVWIEDGTVGGFEGADRCCPMNCTHVYNYAMSAAYLFPALERNVRETDLLVQMHPTEHYIPHRTILPLSLPRLGFQIGGPEHPALDGELGTILKTYREWQMHGDRAWLDKVWERTRTLMLYIMDAHDKDGDGVIRGEQPNTYDTHLFGSNTFIGTLYLAALRAAEEMALLMGDKENATTFRARFEKGREGYDQTCWNGEYYYNVFDAPEANEKTYDQNNCFGPGCFSDQLLGQWWAHILGLGYVLPKERVLTALQAMHKYNWRSDLSNHKHSQRVFASGNERGLLCGSWPKEGRPQNPILYCDEVWTGIEYHVAATMIYEGMVTEGLQIVRGVRDRYTGNQRNPWSEIECGQHYARAMSSYSLLHAASGLVYDASKGRLEMAPRIAPENIKCFFVGNEGWGSIGQQRAGKTQRNTVDVRYGSLALREVVAQLPSNVTTPGSVAVGIGSKSIKARAKSAAGRCTIALNDVTLRAGDALRVEMRW